MSRHSKRNHNKVVLPRSYERREIIINYLKDLGPSLSKFGAKILSNELEIHNIQIFVDNVFYCNNGRFSYEDCLAIMKVTLDDRFKKPKEKKNHVFEEMSSEEMFLEYCF